MTVVETHDMISDKVKKFEDLHSHTYLTIVWWKRYIFSDSMVYKGTYLVIVWLKKDALRTH